MKLRTVGSLWLQEFFNLKQFALTHHSYIGQNAKLELSPTGEVHQVYGTRYAPANDTVFDHLEFSLKYDDLNLAFLKVVFNRIPEKDIIAWIAASPSGKYTRKIGFLYEFLTGKQLEPEVKITGTYVDLLEADKYVTGRDIKSTKWHVTNNLLGTAAFCPVIRKTNSLIQLLQTDLKEQVARLKDSYSSETLSRAINYLFNKETRSSYEIEKEKPSPARTERFIALLTKAGGGPSEQMLREESLTQLQNAIVDARYAAVGYRDFQNYIGQTHPNYYEVIHYICPPPEFVHSLMEGLKAAADKTEGTAALIRAAIVSFGFVFIHPFEDGNGRLHRFLIHDMLVRAGVVPTGLIIPVSAHMLNHMNDYDEALESFSKPLMHMVRYTKKANEEVEITNKEEVEGYFRYPDLTVPSTFLAQTVQATVADDMPQELEFIQRYDELKRELQNITDMPDKHLDRMIIFLHQNKGVLPKRRRNDFDKLTDGEIKRMERAFQEVFELDVRNER